MEPLKIWHAPVQGYAEIVEDPQVKHMKSLVTVAGAGETGAPVTLVNHPVLYDGETADGAPAAPAARRPDGRGAEGARAWREAEIEALAEDKVVTLRATPECSVIVRMHDVLPHGRPEGASLR